MRICLISHDYVPNIGGIAAHVANLAAHLAKRGHQVIVVTLRYSRSLPFRQQSGNLEVVRFLVPNVSKLRGLCFVIQAAPFLFAVSLWRRFDVVHWHNFFPDALIALFGRAKRTVFTNHSSTFLEIYEKGGGRLIQWLTRYADKIIGPSRELAEKSCAFFHRQPNDVACIPNGVDTDLFRPLDPDSRRRKREKLFCTYKMGPETSLIVCPRRLEPKNGVRYFVEAVPTIVMRYPQTLCLILGNDADPEYAKEVRALSRRIGVDGYIKFLGPVPNTEIVSYYQVADVVVLPSLMEATSIAGLEAMACGVPIVGTDVGGIPEIVRDGHNGIIVPPCDPEAIAAAITALMDDPELRDRLSTRARELAEACFSWTRITDQTLEAYIQDAARMEATAS